MTPQLLGKRIVVTGAGRGIGRAYALAMARAGARIVVNDIGGDLRGERHEEGSLAEAVVAAIDAEGGEAIADTHDVSDPEAAAAMLARSQEAFGGLDALVNNAAVEFRGSVEAHRATDWDRVMGVNARGSFNCARAAIPLLRAAGGGVILNTTSGGFWEGTENIAAYAASKAAVFSLTLSLHTELAGEGIRTNCIAPNATRTRMVESWIEHMSQSGSRPAEEVVAAYGIQAPENLAPLAITLCSDAAKGISGRVFEVWDDRISVIDAPRRGKGIERAGDTWQVEDLRARLRGLVS